MSTPENILSKYRTYSYHHVLVACESTSVAETLAKSGNLYKYINAPGDEQYTKNSISRNPSTNSGGIIGDYIIITNNMVDSNFFIDDLKWMTVVAPTPPKKGEDFEQFASFAVEGSMVVTEPASAARVSLRPQRWQNKRH